MKAAILTARNMIRVEDTDMPEPGEKEVLVRVKASGICGSDIPRVLGTAASHYPMILGHEFSGVVEAVGSKVTKVKTGQRVAGIPLLPCGRCYDCQKGNFAQCKHYSFIGSRQNGSWAEFVVLPENNVLILDKRIGFVDAAFIEPATVALHALRRIKFQGGEHVLVLGAGTIGLLTLQWANLFGARAVTVMDISEKRLALAKQLGAAHTLHAQKDPWYECCQEITGGRGFSVVFEAAGVNSTFSQAFQLVAAKGSVCLIGTSSTDLTFDHKEFELLNRKEFFLTGSWMSYSAPFPGDEWHLSHEAIQERKILTTPLLYKTLKLEQANEAFDEYRNARSVPGKFMFTFN